jgi:hypothetical protein
MKDEDKVKVIPQVPKPKSPLSFLKEKGALRKWFIASEIIRRRD